MGIHEFLFFKEINSYIIEVKGTATQSKNDEKIKITCPKSFLETDTCEGSTQTENHKLTVSKTNQIGDGQVMRYCPNKIVCEKQDFEGKNCEIQTEQTLFPEGIQEKKYSQSGDGQIHRRKDQNQKKPPMDVDAGTGTIEADKENRLDGKNQYFERVYIKPNKNKNQHESTEGNAARIETSQQNSFIQKKQKATKTSKTGETTTQTTEDIENNQHMDKCEAKDPNLLSDFHQRIAKGVRLNSVLWIKLEEKRR